MHISRAALLLALMACVSSLAEAAGTGDGVVSYPAAYFAASNPNTAMDMIARLPGFSFDPGAQVRGFAGAAGNVILDGERPTTKQDDLESLLRRVPASQVDHIEIIRGGAPGIDMQGRTVLANIVRRKGGGLQGVVAPVLDYLPKDGRVRPSLRLEGSRRLDRTAIEGALVIINFLDDGVGGGPHTHYDSPTTAGPLGCVTLCTGRLSARGGGTDARATTAIETPLAGGTLRLNGLLSDQTYLDREHDVFNQVSQNDVTHATQETSKAELGARYSRALNAQTTLEALAIQQAQRRVSVSDYRQGGHDHFREADILWESVASLNLRYRFNDRLTVSGSAEGAYNVQDSRSAYLQNGVAQALPAANVRVAETRGEFASDLTWAATPKLSLTAGLKVEVSNITSSGDVSHDDTLSYPKPRLVLTWSPLPTEQVRLRVEREVGQLDFASFVATSALNTTGNVHVGNPDLTPQDVWVYEAALEHRFWKTADLTVTLRHSEISNAVDRVTDGAGDDLAGNIGSATENELITDLTLPLDPFRIHGGLLKGKWTWRDTEATDPTTGLKRPLSQIHPQDGQIELTQDLKSLHAVWEATIFGALTEHYYRFNEIDRYRLGAWVQLAYEYKPEPGSSWRFELNNLTSRPFTQSFTVFAGPRPASLSSIDYRNQRSGPELHLRYRHTFN